MTVDDKIKKAFPKLWEKIQANRNAPTIEERLSSVEKAIVDIALMQSGGDGV